MLNPTQIQALISLLNETDPKIFSHLKAALFEIGETALPYLDEALTESDDIDFQHLLTQIIEELNSYIVYKQLYKWYHTKNPDILEGYYIVTKFQYPSLIFQNLKDTVNKLSMDLWLELNSEMTALEMVKTINQFMFHKLKFKSDYENPSLLSNMYLNTVLEKKIGNDISLGILYYYLAQKQNMPIFGVNLPMNFVLCYTKGVDEKNLDDILFYINPYNKGFVFDYIVLENHFKSSSWQFRKENALPISVQDIIHRLLKGLLNSYMSEEDTKKTNGIRKLLEIFEN